MDANKQMLYSELRTIRKELKESLMNETCSPLIKPIIEEELKDIEATMERLETGKFGLCEISGEHIPNDYLLMIPTIKSLEDVHEISKFYCKPIYT